MRRARAGRLPRIKLRRARLGDLDTLIALERAAFNADVLSRRSFRHFLTSRTATVLVAEMRGELIGYALVLYPPNWSHARLYSLAVDPRRGGRGIGTSLLAAAERAARRRGRHTMRLEVHENNTRAIARYEKSGYRLFGRHRDYYDDHGDALRFDKPLTRQRRRDSQFQQAGLASSDQAKPA